ncbi:MAG: hypothetical protein GC149_20450 [Gammaproteobacteria bacterium]|nr:hypothetical protein [Gammaproteobacteria bacterium]
MSYIKNARTFPPRTGRGNKMPYAAVTSQAVAERVSSALRSAVSGLRAPGKQVSRMTGRNPRTIRNLMDGSNAPSAATLIELMRDFDEVYIEVLRLANRVSDEPSGSDIKQRIETAINILSGGEHEISPDRISQMAQVFTGKES